MPHVIFRNYRRHLERQQRLRQSWATFWFYVALGVIMLCLVGTAKADVPWYCKALLKYERSCEGVKAASRVMGQARSEKLARRCGASDAEIEQARACLREGSNGRTEPRQDAPEPKAPGG